ncbi:hypothetical protein NDN08_005785 [Rhodosorus marinus]|uniref:Non-homologous end-joining factor 1 n=1 Tax=Rhodosorus marinus TaxID=101924 RepID=A0AAV8V4B6_9RHOD|nr:hypothetical protein NDN08_005785 [Rhodosorus marinus]
MSDSKPVASRWRRIEKGFIAKFELAELPYRVVATDFGTVFTCDVDGVGFRQQRESHYPGEESVTDHDVLLEVQSLVDRADPRIEEVHNGKERRKLKIKFTAEMDGIQFEWVFVLQPASPELSQVVVRDELVQPLLDVQSALTSQRDKLFRLLLAKDTEILAYKSEMEKSGLCPIRRSLITEAFESTNFLSDWDEQESLIATTSDLRSLVSNNLEERPFKRRNVGPPR